jgi:hypothetical protein
VAWAGRKTKFALPMEASDLQRIHKPRQVATMAILAMLAAFGYVAWMLMSESQQWYSIKDELDSQKMVWERVELELNDEVEAMKALGFDVNMIEGTMDLYEQFQKNQMRPLTFFDRVGRALGPDLRLDKIEMDYVPPPQPRSQSGYNYNPVEVEEPEPQLRANLQLSFPPTVDLEIGYREVRDFARRLSAVFPDHDVKIERQVADRSYSAESSGEIGKNKQEALQQDYVAEISVRGPAQ